MYVLDTIILSHIECLLILFSLGRIPLGYFISVLYCMKYLFILLFSLAFNIECCGTCYVKLNQFANVFSHIVEMPPMWPKDELFSPRMSFS